MRNTNKPVIIMTILAFRLLTKSQNFYINEGKIIEVNIEGT